jgi:hypothetical protein
MSLLESKDFSISSAASRKRGDENDGALSKARVSSQRLSAVILLEASVQN